MKRRHIDLPEPAAGLWNRARTLVDGLLQECKTLEHDRWYLGGGTALAADWHHRRSSDIDILIAPGLSMGVLEGQSNRIEKLIARTKGERINAPDQKLSVKYEKDGKVDIFSSGRQLPGHEESVEIDSRATLRLTNAQIFAGKFRRAIDRQVAARDLFDICHAARIKEPGMQQALNALTEPEVNRIKEFWESSRAKIEEQAKTRLAGVPPEIQIDPERLLELSLRTTDDHRYAEMVIQAGNDQTTVRTVTIGGQTNEYRSTGSEIETDFQALGVARHLKCHNIGLGQVIRDAQEAMKESSEQTIRETGRGGGPNGPRRALANAAGSGGGQAPQAKIGTPGKPPATAPPKAEYAAEAQEVHHTKDGKRPR